MSDTLEDNAESRQKFITEMKTFVENECSEIGEILAKMSWTPDHILKKKSVEQCPHDCGHLVLQSSLKQHTRACGLKKMGLSTEQVETELRNDDLFYNNTNLVGKILVDEGLLNRILWNYCMEHRQVHAGHRSMPVSADDWTVKLSAQERLAVYEYCVQTLKAEGKMANVERDEVLTTDWEKIIKKGMLEHEGNKPKSGVELLAMLRDQKRRRQSYRGKNVHVTKKSYTEIIREVILNQMEIMGPREDSDHIQSQEDAPSTQDRDSLHPSPSQYYRSRSPRRSHSPGRKSRHSRRESPSPESGRYSRRRRQDRRESPRQENHSPGSRHGPSRRSGRHRRDSPDVRRRSSDRSESRSSRYRSPHQQRSSSSSADDRESTWGRHGDGNVMSSLSDRTDQQRIPSQGTSLQDFQDEPESDDNSLRSSVLHKSRKKHSKHKKHKHKKKKSKSYHSDSE